MKHRTSLFARDAMALTVLAMLLLLSLPALVSASPPLRWGDVFAKDVSRDLLFDTKLKVRAQLEEIGGTYNVDVSLSSGEQFQNPRGWDYWSVDYDVHFADVDGDGKSDIVGRKYSTGAVRVGLSNGQRFLNSTPWGNLDMDLNIQFADVNGDNKADILGRSFTTGDIKVGISTGAQFLEATPWGEAWSPGHDIYYADVSGDGKEDIVGIGFSTGDILVGLSDGVQFQNSSSWGNWDMEYDAHFADVNGDGKFDTVGRSRSTGDIRVSLSNGVQLQDATSWGEWSQEYNLDPADVNGQGMVGIIGRDSSTNDVQVGLSDGEQFQDPDSWGGWSSEYDTHYADVNGDGKADLIGRTPPGRVFTAPVFNENIDSYELPCKSGGEFVAMPYYSLGESFEGLSRTASDRECDDEYIGQRISGPYNMMSDMYGDCTIEEDDEGGCSLPLEVQTWPACVRTEASVDEYPLPYEEVQIGGTDAIVFKEGHLIELYTNNATVAIFGNDPEQVRRAAENVERRTDDGAAEIPCEAPGG